MHKFKLFEGFSKTKKWIIIIVTCLIVLNLSLTGFLVYLNQKPKTEETVQEDGSVMEMLEEATKYQDNDLYRNLMPQIAAYIGKYGYESDTWSVTAIDTVTGEVATWNNHPMCSASIIKQFIMGAVYEHYDELLSQYDESSLNSLLFTMITRSDNDCANALINRLGYGDDTKGIEAVNAFLKKYGYTQTNLDHTFYGGQADSKDNMASSLDNANFQWDILKGRFEHSEDMLNLLKQQYWTYKIPGGVPYSVKTANKTGDLEDIENDCAIIFADNGTYILSIMSNNLVAAKSAQATIRGVSSIAYSYFKDLDRSGNENNSEENEENKEDAIKTETSEIKKDENE